MSSAQASVEDAMTAKAAMKNRRMMPPLENVSWTCTIVSAQRAFMPILVDIPKETGGWARVHKKTQGGKRRGGPASFPPSYFLFFLAVRENPGPLPPARGK